MTPRIVFRSILLFALVIGVGALIKFTPLGDTLNEAWMDEYVRDTGIRGELLFIGIGAIFTSVGLHAKPLPSWRVMFSALRLARVSV